MLGAKKNEFFKINFLEKIIDSHSTKIIEEKLYMYINLKSMNVVIKTELRSGLRPPLVKPLFNISDGDI